LRLSKRADAKNPFGEEFDAIFSKRKEEADTFYSYFSNAASGELGSIQRQAFAGLLWNKQFYHYIVKKWLTGDKIVPPIDRLQGRNHEWIHIYAEDILSMPDKWEYPWFASWDIAFHITALAIIDPDFAKKQLLNLTREWYMHPNGQIPAYEWNFNDVNPPVHAWAAWQIYEHEQKIYGKNDRLFLERVFQKLLLNFTWWVNRKDQEGKNIFQGGFLGLDNVSLFDRSGKHLEHDIPFASLDQADGTAWMGVYCLNMMRIALELAQKNSAYEDIACKFFVHFLYIASAMQTIGLWNQEDKFYYDAIHRPNGEHWPIKVRSMVGLIPLLGVEIIDQQLLRQVPDFEKRMHWFLTNRKDLAKNVICQLQEKQHIFSLVTLDQLSAILTRVFDTNEFLSPFGIRSLSKFHEENPFTLVVGNHQHVVRYEPAESTTITFGGNSNWRGPVWFPVNYLLIEALQKFHQYLGDRYTTEFPTHAEQTLTLHQISQRLSKWLIRIFLPDAQGNRPVYGSQKSLQTDPLWNSYILFYEYFDGDTGVGKGASHQTGWTALVANLIFQMDELPTN
jgi:hypothetical protein